MQPGLSVSNVAFVGPVSVGENSSHHPTLQDVGRAAANLRSIQSLALYSKFVNTANEQRSSLEPEVQVPPGEIHCV